MKTLSLPLRTRRRALGTTTTLAAFDPALPVDGSLVVAGELRDQFNGLAEMIAAVPSVNSAVVDEVTTLPPGEPAAVSLSLSDHELHFSFAIPRGDTGGEGAPGPPGANGSDGPPGPPGEVTLVQLYDAVAAMTADSSANCNAVGTLSLSPSDPPTQAEVQAIVDKVNELILALWR